MLLNVYIIHFIVDHMSYISFVYEIIVKFEISH